MADADHRDDGQPRRRVLGIDGCKGGWVGIVLGPGPAVAGVFGSTIDATVAAAGDVDVVAVDMPVHPPDEGVRACDEAARALLERRRSTLFLAPTRAVLAAETYAAALAAARAADGRGISRQAWALRDKILEVDRWLEVAPCPVYEVHPEVSFAHMVDLVPGMVRRALPDRKTSWAGQAARRAALAEVGIVIPDDIGEAGRRAAADDVLDAAAAAWTARRIDAGAAVTLPDPPTVLADGRVQAIWA